MSEAAREPVDRHEVEEHWRDPEIQVVMAVEIGRIVESRNPLVAQPGVGELGQAGVGLDFQMEVPVEQGIGQQAVIAVRLS